MAWRDGSFTVDGPNRPPKVGENRTLFIVGPAKNVWEDWEDCRWLPADILTVNDMLAYLPEPVNYACSVHDDRLMAWYGVRRLIYAQTPTVRLISPNRRDGIDQTVRFLDADLQPFMRGSSIESSGVYAMCVGLVLGYTRIILAGCPGDGRGHLYYPPYRPCQGYADAGAQQAWERAMTGHHEIAERVRSCSGMTRDLLGEPLPWLSQLSRQLQPS